MIILGIDPGSYRTGYGVIEAKPNGRHEALAFETITASPKKELSLRLAEIYEEVCKVLERHRPACMAVEEVFFAHDVRSALTLGHVRGALLLAGVQHGLEIVSYSPASVKQAVSGSGRAEKAQVQRMVRSILRLESLPAVDAADALAIAICHAQSFRMGTYDRTSQRAPRA